MSWETHEAAKRIADGWYAELEDTRKRNAVLGRENAKLREELTAEHALAETLGHYHELEQAENAKLRELAAKMARALGVNSEWCNRDCEREFGCGCEPCPLDQALLELGVEVD